MKVIDVRNVNAALVHGLDLLRTTGVTVDTRNGPAVVSPEPVTTVYRKPEERVLFLPERDANPFFHLYEGLWMLAGRNDVAGVAQYARNMKTFSDDGKTLNGAYGYRWRTHFHGDQLHVAIQKLIANQNDRRVIVAMWDAGCDSAYTGKDVPCNLAIHFQAWTGRLDMTVFNRSNDIIWGAYGANAVHMSMLQEFVAGAIGLPVGSYWQVSDNFHAYKDLFEKLAPLADLMPDGYSNNKIPDRYQYDVPAISYPMVNTQWSHWLRDLSLTINEGSQFGARDPFFNRIVTPMLSAHACYKNKKHYGAERFQAALDVLGNMPPMNDWRIAASEWIQRREAEAIRAADDGVPHE